MRHGGRIVPKISRPRMCMHLENSLLSASRMINSMNGDISRRESTTGEMAQALVEARTTLATKSYDFDEARLRSRNAAIALEASIAAFAALAAETDRLRASRHHHSK